VPRRLDLAGVALDGLARATETTCIWLSAVDVIPVKITDAGRRALEP
jgi:hypothetical protein